MRRGLLPSRVRDVGIKYCSEGVPGEDLFSAFGVLPSPSGLSTHEYVNSGGYVDVLPHYITICTEKTTGP